ncbi:hypothetical protein V1504DRAFT_459811 [Lipomyces starkeyi]
MTLWCIGDALQSASNAVCLLVAGRSISGLSVGLTQPCAHLPIGRTHRLIPIFCHHLGQILYPGRLSKLRRRSGAVGSRVCSWHYHVYWVASND